MNWEHLIYYALIAAISWTIGSIFAFKQRRTAALIISCMGSAVFLIYIIGMWISLQRPPMRTLGETRLWYSLFLSMAGILVYARWKYPWMLTFSTVLAVVFMCINIFKPEIHDQSLMPALQSAWFIPHVIVYMMAYALLGAVAVFALYLWLRPSRQVVTAKEMSICDNLVRIGWAFLTLGIVMGALWAKQAWGDYWSWDPKETWAAATWFSYLLYLHLRPWVHNDYAFALILFSFILLQMCWYGINYLPSAQGSSIHTY
ncbi:MAG: cytochrome c biogenesis protein [Phocaeicola sp.]|uniref:cytochrome c biogenesis protein n=1 Tax=Phocaeicola sp. TaxID=2773926 RepID=UPI003FA14062